MISIAMFFCFVINLLLYKVGGAPITEFVNDNNLLVKEVPFGETVLLQCKSNVEDFNFDYWLYNNRRIVIGPSNNNYDRRKYRYEILSGNLTVRGVTKHDQGLYTCVSRKVNGDQKRIEEVYVIVLLTWEEEFEHNTKINAIKTLIVLIVLVILGAVGYFAYTIWKDRFRYPRYLEQSEDDDDSAEELFIAPSTSGTSKVGRKAEDKESFDNISTDFKSILDAANEN